MKYILRWVFCGILVVIVATVILNWRWIYDYYLGLTYEPSTEMMRIRADLQLTSAGEFLFNASQPALEDRDDFNETCRAVLDIEIAVLGCYREGKIYVYNIQEDELDGILELTTAHELLHAVYARMSEGERRELNPVLEKVYETNLSLFENDLRTYQETEKLEELFVRSGTEIKDLPDVLEKKYAEYFKDQDRIVDYYEKYIAVFKRIEAEMDELSQEMNNLENEINIKTEEYEKRLAQLNANIVSFNSCAAVVGCFNDETDFMIRRERLVNEQTLLGELYKEIDSLIDMYNGKIEQYNQDVIYSDKLNKIINSSEKPDSLE